MDVADEKKLEGEIKREFQLERMILFSDAVFAIVITLMAIDIKIPESEKKYTSDEMLHQIKLLLPTILAYVVSFVVIGLTWYRHLKIFSRLKDYDKGLVIRNLVLLFWVGLFPFGASLTSHPNSILLPYIVYFIIAIMSALSQVALLYYMFYIRTGLLISPPLQEEKDKVKISILLLACLMIALATGVILFNIIQDPETKPLAFITLLIVPISKRIFEKHLKVKAARHK